MRSLFRVNAMILMLFLGIASRRPRSLRAEPRVAIPDADVAARVTRRTLINLGPRSERPD
jgi:hypothetical protein